MTTAQSDFGDMHLNHALSIVGAPSGVKTATARTLVGVEDLLDGNDCFLGQMIQLQKHRSLAALQLLIELPHHLPAPVIALDEALALAIGRVAPERPGDVG